MASLIDQYPTLPCQSYRLSSYLQALGRFSLHFKAGTCSHLDNTYDTFNGVIAVPRMLACTPRVNLHKAAGAADLLSLLTVVYS
jgi:hypothetical protein